MEQSHTGVRFQREHGFAQQERNAVNVTQDAEASEVRGRRSGQHIQSSILLCKINLIWKSSIARN